MRKPWRRSLEWTTLQRFVTMGELARFKEVHEVELPSLNKEVYGHATVTVCEEVTTPRLEEHGTQTLFVNTSTIPKDHPRWRSQKRSG